GAESGGAGVVSLLNFAWGIGAVACAPLFSVALRHHSLTTFFWTLSVVAIVLAIAFVFAPLPDRHHDQAASMDANSKNASIPPVHIPAVVAALYFLYVGCESALGGWAAEHAKRLEGHATSLTTMSPLFFYAGLMVGRGLGSLVLPRVGSVRVIIAAFSLSIA